MAEAGRPRRDARARARLRLLSPAVDVRGPRIRLGLAWAVVSTAVVAAGGPAGALVLSMVALAAAGQAVRSWRRVAGPRPFRPVAVAGAVLLPMAALRGPAGVLACVAVVAVATVAAAALVEGVDARATAAVALLIGAGSASVVVVRDELGPVPALVLLACAHVYDASVFVIGSGSSSPVEGPIAGAAAMAVVALAAAAVLVPPFRGASPWVLLAAAVWSAPAGTYAATALLGDRRARVPALRRIDSLLVLGPVWGVLGSITLDVAR